MTLKEAVHIIDSGAWLSLRIITANVAKGTGGEVKEMNRCRKYKASQPKPELPTTTVGHRAHAVTFTRNMAMYGSRQLRKIHPILITHLNGKTVL